MGRQKKDKYADLDESFKQEVETLSVAQLRDKITSTALNLEALLELKDNDEDLKLKKEVAKEAGAVYREGKKYAKMATGYLRAMLDAKGQDTGSAEAAE